MARRWAWLHAREWEERTLPPFLLPPQYFRVTSQDWIDILHLVIIKFQVIQVMQHLSGEGRVVNFGRCYDVGRKDRHQVKQLHVISAGLWSINNTQLPGTSKILSSIWCLTANTNNSKEAEQRSQSLHQVGWKSMMQSYGKSWLHMTLNESLTVIDTKVLCFINWGIFPKFLKWKQEKQDYPKKIDYHTQLLFTNKVFIFKVIHSHNGGSTTWEKGGEDIVKLGRAFKTLGHQRNQSEDSSQNSTDTHSTHTQNTMTVVIEYKCRFGSDFVIKTNMD